jgi:hypothetical protein
LVADIADIAGTTLSKAVPPASCGQTWKQLSLTAAASLQAAEAAECFQPSAAQWRAVRAAIRIDANHSKEN